MVLRTSGIFGSYSVYSGYSAEYHFLGTSRWWDTRVMSQISLQYFFEIQHDGDTLSVGSAEVGAMNIQEIFGAMVPPNIPNVSQIPPEYSGISGSSGMFTKFGIFKLANKRVCVTYLRAVPPKNVLGVAHRRLIRMCHPHTSQNIKMCKGGRYRYKIH